MENFDLNKAKSASIILFILIVFVLIVGNAYNYLPSEDANNIPNINSETTQSIDNENSDYEESDSEEEKQEENDDINLNDKNSEVDIISNNKNENNTITNEHLEVLENISDLDSPVENTQTQDSFSSIYANAIQLKNDKQFAKAVNEFKNASSMTDNSKEKSECYEEIAIIYAIAKKYGTALAFAQKAYNMYPSTSKEILLARLYYKTGEIDKATQRVNNILKRDFSQDK